MRLLIVAVGQRLPSWAQTAADDYAKRLPLDIKLELKAIKTEPRPSAYNRHGASNKAGPINPDGPWTAKYSPAMDDCKPWLGGRPKTAAARLEPGVSKSLAAIYNAERERIEAAIPQGAYKVALDERGSSLDSMALAARFSHWQALGQTIALIIGGPDGLDPALRQNANECLRLSDLTLPHAMVRVLLLEQLYRAWSIQAGHPYHRQ